MKVPHLSGWIDIDSESGAVRRAAQRLTQQARVTIRGVNNQTQQVKRREGVFISNGFAFYINVLSHEQSHIHCQAGRKTREQLDASIRRKIKLEYVKRRDETHASIAIRVPPMPN